MAMMEQVGSWIKERTGLFSGHSSDQQDLLTDIVFQRDAPSRTILEHLKGYSEYPWMRAFVGRISYSVAGVNWRVYRTTRRGPLGRREVYRNKMLQSGACDTRYRHLLIKQEMEMGDLEEVKDHPMIEALQCGNPMHTSMDVRQLTQIYLDLVGECFLYKQRNSIGKPYCFWPVPPSWVSQTPSEPGDTYNVRYGGWQAAVKDEDILWIKIPRPENPYGRGTGFGNALSDELETDEYAAKFLKMFFFNSARPDMLIMPTKNESGSSWDMNRKQMARLERSWLSRLQGFGRAFRPMFIGRAVDIKTFDHNFQNLQLKDIRTGERDIIRQVLGIPPEVMGMLENSNRSTIDAADAFFCRYVIVPRLEALRMHLQEKLAPEYDPRIIVDFDNPVQEDKEFVMNAAKAFPWALTVDESRRLLSLPPLEGEAGKVHMVPVNMMPMSDLSEIRTEPSDSGGAGGDSQALGLSYDTSDKELRVVKQAAEIVKRRRLV